MATKLWHVPVRLATGAIIVDQGLQKLGADEDTAKWLHGQAVHAFPRLADMDPKDFVQLLSASEIALGAALLGIGFVPSGLAGSTSPPREPAARARSPPATRASAWPRTPGCWPSVWPWCSTRCSGPAAGAARRRRSPARTRL
jgi:hypothetical protein